MRKDTDKDISLKNNKDRDRFYQKMSEEQRKLFKSIQEHIFTFCEAVCGTGKTVTTIASMLDLLANNKINKIIYIQKISRRFLQHGFLPGTLEEKTNELWTPFYDAMLTLGYQPEYVDKMVKLGLIILTTDSNLRGVNFEQAGVVAEECENMDNETLKLIFTRCHDNCHIVMIGDSKQKDNPGINTEFIDYGDYLANSVIGNKCTLTKNYRGRFSQLAESYEKGSNSC